MNIATMMQLVVLVQQYGPKVLELFEKIGDVFGPHRVGAAIVELPEEVKKACEVVCDHVNK